MFRLMLAGALLFTACQPSNPPKALASNNTAGAQPLPANSPHVPDTVENFDTTWNTRVLEKRDTLQHSAANAVAEGSLQDLWQEMDKPLQYFTIQSNRDTTIVGKEGTKLHFNGNSFVDERGQPVKGSITIELAEYYTLGDMLQANLCTESARGLLETGGMLYIDAVFGDQRLQLRNGAGYDIEMPAERKQEGMQLFTGEWDEENNMQWTLMKAGSDTIPASFPGGPSAYFRFLNERITLEDNPEALFFNGTPRVHIQIAPNGKATLARIENKVPPTIATTIKNCIEAMPLWQPATVDGRPVIYQTVQPFNFVGIDSSDVSILAVKRLKPAAEAFESTSLNILDVTTINDYLFSSSALGWINCDRFYNSRKPLIDYLVDVGPGEEVDVKLVFHNIASIMHSIGSKPRFAGVPSGEEVTVVVVKRQNGNIYVAIQKGTTGKQPLVVDDFELMDKNQLKEQLKKIKAFR